MRIIKTAKPPETAETASTRKRPINLTLSDEAREALWELSHDERLSQSAYLETLIMREARKRKPEGE